jgi:hypothetical protein
MAAATHCAYSLQLPQVDRLLQEIHPLIWRDRRATHQIAHARGIPLVAGGRNDVQVLKAALTSTPVLQLLDFAQSFVFDCDTSGSSIGAVLHQGQGPIAFFSRAMAPHHAKLATY